jgi:ABC-2 type transport system ATP-binding protein
MTWSRLPQARSLIGLVPQELDAGGVRDGDRDTVRFSRGLFGKRRDDPACIERSSRQLSLWDKRDARTLRTLSGGMKRRVLIAKALAHEPRVLFLDEPTAGVDVELRKDMWRRRRGPARSSGVTIILTTHYIEEAEAMADRIGVIDKGRLLLVEEKAALMKRMGRKTSAGRAAPAVDAVPRKPCALRAGATEDGQSLTYVLRPHGRAHRHHLAAADLREGRDRPARHPDHASSLEEIFVDLVREDKGMNWRAVWRSISSRWRAPSARWRRAWSRRCCRPRSISSCSARPSARGSTEVEGVSYGAFIVPGLIMLTVLTQSISNAAFGIYFPKFLGTIYELLSAPVSFVEIVIGYVGAAATKALMIGLIILARRRSSSISDRASGLDGGVPGADLRRLQPVRLHHRHLGAQFRAVAAGAAADDHAARVPWRQLLLDLDAAAVLADGDAVQPGGLLISGFRWAFADINIGISLMMISVFMLICLGIIGWTFKTGYKIKT